MTIRSTISSILKSLVVSAALFLGTVSATTDQVNHTQYAVDYVCEVLKADCSDVPAPEIGFAHLVDLVGVYGYYWPIYGGEGHIFLDIGFKPFLGEPFPRSVLIHETTHYVEDTLGYGLTSCESEELAFHVANLWLIENKHYEYVKWNWRDYYARC